MRTFFKYHLYIIGLSIVTIATLYLNWDCPPNFDEANAWNIARDLSPLEIFTISKTEGHPFLWYYLIMPLAKTNFFYPWSLYSLNLAIMLGALFLLYKYAPLPTYLKYAITFSAPFLLLFSAFARSYSLTILLLFLALSLYPQRHQKPLLYLFSIILLANTSIIALFAAFSLGFIYFIESCHNYFTQKQKKSLFISILFGIIEIVLFYLQFYNYDTNVPASTPKFGTLADSIESALPPLNLYSFGILIGIILYILAKQKCYQAVSFLILTYAGMLTLFATIYQGSAHHYTFLYIYLIATYWLATEENTLNTKQILPLTLIAVCFIFSLNLCFKIRDKVFLQNLRDSAFSMNNQFHNQNADILFIEPFEPSVITPYINKNITLHSQTMADTRTLKGHQQIFYYFYQKIDVKDISNYIKDYPQTLIFRTCGDKTYHNTNLSFTLKYYLNSTYCLYDIKAN